MSNDDLNTLRPDVREAVDAFDIGARVGMTFGNKTWNTIRAELLRLANENFMLNRINVAPFKQELDGERMHVAALTARCQRVEAELAALKARISGSVELRVGDPAWSDGTLADMEGNRVRLMVMEE